MRPAEKIDVSYNAIFYSAFKALVVFELLLESPKTFTQIYNAIENIPYIKSNISKDSLRVYINSFKQAGCEVTKVLTKARHREYAFFIPNNPFRPTISKKQISRFFDIYDILMYNSPFEDFLQTELLVRKLDEEIKDPEFHSAFEKHSLIKNFDIDLMVQLEQACHSNSLVTVLYKSPRSGKKEIPILAYKMFFQNYKLYLNGYGLEYKQEAIFPIDRILEIINITDGSNIKIPEASLNITYELYNPDIEILQNEEIIKEENRIKTISHKTDNKIISLQRFLQLGVNCKILAPESFRDYFVATLKSAREVYAYGQ